VRVSAAAALSAAEGAAFSVAKDAAWSTARGAAWRVASGAGFSVTCALAVSLAEETAGDTVKAKKDHPMRKRRMYRFFIRASQPISVVHRHLESMAIWL
jgi:hypothetical protein